ncbi:hypothetical protein ATI61_109198 [Archangium gephyra]|uniref:Uncharacterized protein n=1 Tax=Archangium gephyra TaxID=48 RepID=A0AAC8TB61_9BACT|nr:hypothetical protein [Archangium gephyra]AKI99611.1 Hypothetical protein AA314_01238 [Archangium gephyra]REG27857.1 hypothetical protein ATI61_109198 [Archangium gephyra]
MSVHTLKKPSFHSPSVMRRGGSLLTAALCLLLAGSGCGPATYDELEPGDHLSLLFPPEGCEVARTCEGLAQLNCRVEVDGPSFYVERLTGRVVSSCGTACEAVEPKPDEGRCACPPKAWTCQ